MTNLVYRNQKPKTEEYEDILESTPRWAIMTKTYTSTVITRF